MRPESCLVVFDVNIFLDVASLVGEPFSLDKFDHLVAKSSNATVPHPNPAYDSLRAIATCQSGNFDGIMPLEVWTSDHIDELTYLKSVQPTTASIDEDRGLGWAVESAQILVDDLVGELVFEQTSGSSVGEVNISYGAPPLSHEDGCVYATAKNAGTEDNFYYRYCITRDRHFLSANLPGDIEVLHPSQWVSKVRSARLANTMKRMLNTGRGA